jgi:hypothetical protein
MKWIFTFSTILSLASAQAQQSTEHQEKFCEVWTVGRNLFGYWEVYADSGQARYGLGNRQLLMRDQKGIIRFQSKMAALNYLGERGWTLISTHTTTEPTAIQNISDTRYYYLFRKVSPRDERLMIDNPSNDLIYRKPGNHK